MAPAARLEDNMSMTTGAHKMKRATQRGAFLVMISVMSFALGGCEMLGLGGETSTPPPPTTPKKKPPIKKIEPEVVAELEEEGEYQRPNYPENTRRNPFRPVIEVIVPVQEAVNDEKRPVEPLEQFSISQLELAAIISETVVPKAMFIDPNGFGHVVKAGDRIGLQGGTITDIRDNEVDIQETSGEDENAKDEVRTIQLRSFEMQASQDEAEDLSEAERSALERLLSTEEGRAAVRSSLLEESRDGTEQGAQGRQGSGIAPPTQ